MTNEINKPELSAKDVFISGFALFSMYFGAGNMILPPMMGLHAGSNWFLSWIGFSMSGVGLIIIGMRSMARIQGDISAFGSKISKNFGVLVGAVIITCVGPLMSIPRTAATVYEVAMVNLNPNITVLMTSIVFFILTWLFSIRESKIIDIIGGYMTPLLLIILTIIIVKGIVTPISSTIQGPPDQLAAGFLEGYHTMDSIGSLILASMILNDFKQKGVKSEKGLAKYTTLSGIIAGVGLALVYGGLTYLGATAHSIAPEGVSRADLLNIIVTHLIGANGSIVLYIGISLACLTTSIGLTSAFSNFFNEASDGKISYPLLATGSVIVSFIISIAGIDQIMSFSLPILMIIYPIVIVLMLLNILDDYFPDDPIIFRIPVALTAILSITDGIKAFGFDSFFLVKIFDKLPLSSQNLHWMPVAIVGFIIGVIIAKAKGGDKEVAA